MKSLGASPKSVPKGSHTKLASTAAIPVTKAAPAAHRHSRLTRGPARERVLK